MFPPVRFINCSRLLFSALPVSGATLDRDLKRAMYGIVSHVALAFILTDKITTIVPFQSIKMYILKQFSSGDQV